MASCHQKYKNQAESSASYALIAAPAITKDAYIKPPKTFPMLDSITTLTIGQHKVDIKTPKDSVKGNIIILPGWNFPKEDWCKKSSLCKKALTKGFRLILPEMGKSVYSAKFYPQTRKDWQKYPGLSWVSKEMVPTLQGKYGILRSSQANFLLGLSTGARGVVAIGVALPDLFKAGAALSGDYDPSKMLTDRLMIGYLGSFAQFSARWKTGPENLVYHANQLKMGLYLGHGKQDRVVPFNQSLLLYNALKKAHPTMMLKNHWTNAGHNYQYWDSEVDNMLNFFGDFLGK